MHPEFRGVLYGLFTAIAIIGLIAVIAALQGA